MDPFIGELAAAAVWLLANGVYVRAKRKGQHGLVRLVAFFSGFPGTLAAMIVVREGSEPKVPPPPDDETALLEEVRRDRALRAASPHPPELPTGGRGT